MGQSYIMKPTLFNNLCNVHGFCNMNGNTYQEHITIIFKDKLNKIQKSIILNVDTPSNALEKLKEYDIDFTHEHREL